MSLSGFFIAAFVLILLLLVTDTTKLTRGKAKGMIIKVFTAAILVMILPAIWDPVALSVERGSLWLANPLYSFDPTDTCGEGTPVSAYVQANSKRVFSTQTSGTVTVGGGGAGGGGTTVIPSDRSVDTDTEKIGIETVPSALAPILIENQKIANVLVSQNTGTDRYGSTVEGLTCAPDLRMNYLFHRAVFGLSLDVINNQGDVGFLESLTNSLQGIGFAVFGSVTRSVTISFILLSATVVMVGKNIWLMTILSLFPMLAVFSVFPHIGEFAEKLIKMIPPLLMTGVITAGLLLAGSSAVYLLESSFLSDPKVAMYGIEGYNSIDGVKLPQGSATGAGVGNNPGSFDDSLIFWFAAVGTLALAGTIPVMMVPALSSFASSVSSAVQTGIIAGSNSAQSVMQGGAQGAGAAMKGGGVGGAGAMAGRMALGAAGSGCNGNGRR